MSGKAENINNKVLLNIKNYIIGKDSHELLTVERGFIDFNYLIEKNKDKIALKPPFENKEKQNIEKENIKIKGINNITFINQNNINVNININNFNNEKNNKEEKEDINIHHIINSKKKEDKPIQILEHIDNNIKATKFQINDEKFQIIDYIDLKESKIENINLNHLKNSKTYDTFCIGLFRSGLNHPIQLTSLIENSEHFSAVCGHSQCSMFPSIEPDLLNTFINKNSENFKNLSRLVADMCFPLGIKPCFGCSFADNKVDNSPNSQQTFFNIIKNENNDCYYIATIHYFIKMKKQDYIMKYKLNPEDYINNKFKGMNNKDKKFKSNMKMISNILYNKDVLVPESISLISKYPFFTSMEKCLKCIISLQKDDMENLINHLINEAPSPKKGHQIQFFIPKLEKPIILNHQYNKFLKYTDKKDGNNNNILSSSQINMKILLEKITIENIRMIFQLLLLEQKILFLDNNYQTLSKISYLFLDLIYPLTWINTFIPILSIKTVRFLQSPVPFIMGLDEYLLKYSYDNKYINQYNDNSGNDIIIFNIMNNQFISSKTLKKIHKKDIFQIFNLPIIPEKVGEYIYKELKNVKKVLDAKKKDNINNEDIDQQIRMVFLKAMIMLMGDYNNYVFYTENEIPHFNKDAFVQSQKDSNSKKFLGEIVKTQIFNQFLTNEKQLEIKIKNKIKSLNQINNDNKNNYDLIDTSYFKKLVAENQNLLNSEKIRNRAYSSKKQKKKKAAKVKFEIDDINNYFLNSKNDMGSSKGKSKIYNNVMNSIEYKNHEKLHSNMDINDAFSENFNNDVKKERKLSLDRAKSAKKIFRLSNKENEVKEEKQEKEEKEKEIIFQPIKTLLLYPYFLQKNYKDINEITLEKIKTDIKIYSQKNNLKFLIQNTQHVFIRHHYNINNINQKKFYFLPNNYIIQINQEEKKRKSINKNNNKNDDKKILNIIDKNHEDIKFIETCFIIIITNKKRISKSQLDKLKEIFDNKSNILFFANLLLPDIKMKEKRNHKLLTSNSFEDLSKLLFLSLQNLTSDDYNVCRLLTISTFVYYKIDNKKIIYLYENLIRNIYPCILWVSENFWPNFFKLELEDELKNEKEILNLNKFNSNSSINYALDINKNLGEKNDEQIIFEIISFTIDIMLKLRINKKMILNILANNIFKEYEIDENKIKLFIQQISEN